MEKQRCNTVSSSLFLFTTACSRLQPLWFDFFLLRCLMPVLFLTDVAACVAVTPLKTGAKHRRSRRPCWRADPTTTWLTLTTTWMIWGTTGPTLWSTNPSWICANSPKHVVAAHTDTCCSMILVPCCAAQKCSTGSPCPIQSAGGKQRRSDQVKGSCCSCIVGMHQLSKVKTRWSSNTWWMQSLTQHFFLFWFLFVNLDLLAKWNISQL